MPPPSPPRSDPPAKRMFGGRPHRAKKGDKRTTRKQKFGLSIDPLRLKRWVAVRMSPGESKTVQIHDEAVIAMCAVLEKMISKMMQAWKEHRKECRSSEYRELTNEADTLHAGTSITVANLWAALVADPELKSMIQRNRIVVQNFPVAGSRLPDGHRMRMKRAKAAKRANKAAPKSIQGTTEHALYIAQ